MTHKFDPDWTVSPGEILEEWREEKGLSYEAAAQLCGLSLHVFRGVLDGETAITGAIASQLGRGTDISAHLWLGLEAIHRRYVGPREQSTERTRKRRALQSVSAEQPGMAQLGARPDGEAFEYRFPSISWREPILVRMAGRAGWVCRICIAAKGTTGRESDRLFVDEGEIRAHITTHFAP